MIANAPSVIADDAARLAVCLCTCQRPVMLARCLESLGAQIIPDDHAVSLVVVDNDPAGSARLTVAQFCTTASFPVYYVHQPERGIARARNAALDKALELGATWIAMLDDDEHAAPDWLVMLMAPEYRRTPILIGRVEPIYPEPRPFWAPEKNPRPLAEGAPAKYLRTSNVRFCADIARRGLRFDERLGLAGGEDQRFFAAAVAMGFEAHQTNRALVREAAHPTRLTYRYQVTRNYAHHASLAFRRRQDKGIGPLLASLPRLVLSVPIALAELALSPLALVFGRRRFKQFALHGGKRLARVAGVVAALAGHLPQPYRTIHGA